MTLALNGLKSITSVQVRQRHTGEYNSLLVKRLLNAFFDLKKVGTINCTSSSSNLKYPTLTTSTCTSKIRDIEKT